METKTKVCIVVPTYNEARNIQRLLDGIFAQENAQEIADIHVLVVDDTSPDCTASIVKEYSFKNSNVHLLVRAEKNGLGAAYIAGMQYALENIKPDIVFEMDADLSHKPEYIFSMISEIRSGADFVIGSRYIPGGSIPDNWGIRRKMISRGANILARTSIGGQVHDCTSGFRAIRASVLRRVDWNSLHVKGYAFQISLLEAIIRAGGVVREVPIHFIDRTVGESKLRINDILELLKVLIRIGLSRIPAGRRKHVAVSPHI